MVKENTGYPQTERCPECQSLDTKPFFDVRWHCNKCNHRWEPKGKKDATT